MVGAGAIIVGLYFIGKASNQNVHPQMRGVQSNYNPNPMKNDQMRNPVPHRRQPGFGRDPHYYDDTMKIFRQ